MISPKLGLVAVVLIGMVGVAIASKVNQQSCLQNGLAGIYGTLPFALDGRTSNGVDRLDSCSHRALKRTAGGRATLAQHDLILSSDDALPRNHQRLRRALIDVETTASKNKFGLLFFKEWTVEDHPRESKIDFGQPERLRVIAYLSWLTGEGNNGSELLAEALDRSEKLKVSLNEQQARVIVDMNRATVNGLHKHNLEQRSYWLGGKLATLESFSLRFKLTQACVSRPVAEFGEMCQALGELHSLPTSPDHNFFNKPSASEAFSHIFAEHTSSLQSIQSGKRTDKKTKQEYARLHRLAKKGVCEMRRELFGTKSPWPRSSSRCEDQKFLFGSGVNVSIDPPSSLKGKAADNWVVEQGRLGELQSRIVSGAHCEIREWVWFGQKCTERSVKVLSNAESSIAMRYQGERQKNLRWWARRFAEKEGSYSSRDYEARNRFFELTPNAEQMIKEERQKLRTKHPSFFSYLADLIFA